MIEIENTTFSGVGKDFGFNQFVDEQSSVLVDYKGNRVLRGEEYYIFIEGEYEIYVHIEDIRDYLGDYRLDVSCYEQLITLIEVYHDNYPFIA